MVTHHIIQQTWSREFWASEAIPVTDTGNAGLLLLIGLVSASRLLLPSFFFAQRVPDGTTGIALSFPKLKTPSCGNGLDLVLIRFKPRNEARLGSSSFTSEDDKFDFPGLREWTWDEASLPFDETPFFFFFKPSPKLGIRLGLRVSSLELDFGFFLSDPIGELEPADRGLLELSEDLDFFKEKKSLCLNTISDFPKKHKT